MATLSQEKCRVISLLRYFLRCSVQGPAAHPGMSIARSHARTMEHHVCCLAFGCSLTFVAVDRRSAESLADSQRTLGCRTPKRGANYAVTPAASWCEETAG